MWIFSTEFGIQPEENWNEDTIGEIYMRIANSYFNREESSKGQHICKSPLE